MGYLVGGGRVDLVRPDVRVDTAPELHPGVSPVLELHEQLLSRLGVTGLDFGLFGLCLGVERLALFLVLLAVELLHYRSLGLGDLGGALGVQRVQGGDGVRVVLSVVGGGVELGVLAEIFLRHLSLRMIADDGVTHELYASVRGLVYARDAVEGSGLSCAVGAYEGDDLALVDLDGEVVDGNYAAELHGDVFHAQDVFNVLTHWRRPPFRLLWRRSFCRPSAAA